MVYDMYGSMADQRERVSICILQHVYDNLLYYGSETFIEAYWSSGKYRRKPDGQHFPVDDNRQDVHMQTELQRYGEISKGH